MTEFVERQVGDRTLRVCLACAVNEHEQHDATVCTDCAVCLSLARS